MTVGFVSSAQKTQELQRWKVQHEKQSRSFLTPGASLGYLSLPLHHGHGRACTHKQQIKMEKSAWEQENIFLFLSFQVWEFQSEGTGTLLMQYLVLVSLKLGRCQKIVGNTAIIKKQSQIWKNSQWPKIFMWVQTAKHTEYGKSMSKHGRKCDDHCNMFCRVPAWRWVQFLHNGPWENGKPYPCEIRGEGITWLSIKNGEPH